MFNHLFKGQDIKLLDGKTQCAVKTDPVKLGLIPSFISYCHGQTNAVGVKSIMEAYYGFPTALIEGGETTSDGVYKYEGDPDLAWIAVFQLSENVFVFVYDYGIITVCDGEKTLTFRMD